MIHRHIIDYSIGGSSNSWIARYFHISRNTVACVLAEYRSLLEEGNTRKIQHFLRQPLGRIKSDRPTCPHIAEEARQLILSLLAHKRRVQHGKQHINTRMICDKVHQAGYEYCNSTIYNFVRFAEHNHLKAEKKEDTSYETHIRIAYMPGIECQFDWGRISLAIKGRRRRKYFIAVFTFPYSMGRYAYIFTHEDRWAFMEAHRNFFKHAGGVPEVMTYDNMRVAIAKFVGFNKRKLTDSLKNLMAFYHFDYRFCNIEAGNEKGSVEESVEFIRNEAFGKSSEFTSLAEAQEHLTATCTRLNASIVSPSTTEKKSRLQEELSNLHHVNGEIACAEMMEYSVDKYSCVLMNHVHYSVPEAYTMKRVFVVKHSEMLEFKVSDPARKNNLMLIATHERHYYTGGRELWIMNPYHFLDTFEQKPKSFMKSEAFLTFPKRLQKFINGYSQRYSVKEVIAFMRFAHDCGFVYHDILDLLALCHKNGLRRPSLGTLQSVLTKLKQQRAGNPSNIEQLFSRLLAAQNLDERSRAAVKQFLTKHTKNKEIK